MKKIIDRQFEVLVAISLRFATMGTLPLLTAPAVALARAKDVALVVETGNGTMVNSNYTACKLIDELDAKQASLLLYLRR